MDPVELAVETVKQLISLATAIITVAVTFYDKFDVRSDRRKFSLRASVVSHFICIFFGVWALQAITGAVASNTSGEVDIFRRSIAIPSGLQITTFLAGVFFMIRYFLSLNATNQKSI